MIQKSVDELAKEYGFTFKSTCHCDGHFTAKYVKPERMELKWRKYKQEFCILQGRKIIVGWTKILSLAQCLEEKRNLKLL